MPPTRTPRWRRRGRTGGGRSERWGSSLTWRATITGRVISKKNSRRIYGRVSLPSQAYAAFRDDALWQLRGKTPKEPIAGPFALAATFQMKGKARTDLDNMVTSFLDVLMDAGVIADDNDCYAIDARKVAGGEYRAEVAIETQSVSG